MAKGKKQSAKDLIDRYEKETIDLQKARLPHLMSESKPDDRLIESLRRNINRVVMLPVNLLIIAENVRRSLDRSSPEFHELVDSIKQNGVRQNVIVDLQEENEGFRLAVVAGQRRVLAARQAGAAQVAALILKLKDRGERLVEGLAENLLREDLYCLDQAEAYAALIAEGWTEEEISQKFERRRKTILQFLRLARYPDKAKEYIREHREHFTTYLLFNKFIARKWKSDAELMNALKAVVEGDPPRSKNSEKITAEGKKLVRAVQSFNGLSCRISGTKERGKIVISYQSNAALEKVISLFEVD